MDIFKSIFRVNIISYLSFFLYIVLFSNETWVEEYGLLGFLPYFVVAYSTMEFNFKVEPRLKRMKAFTIPDFLFRVVGMFLGFFATTFSYQSQEFRLVVLAITILFLINVMLETKMKDRSMEVGGARAKEELTASELYYSGHIDIVARQAVSLVETVLLCACIVIGIGFNQVTDIVFKLSFGMIAVCILAVYMKMSYTTLLRYYENSQQARLVFLKENTGIAIMLSMMLVYGALRGYESFLDFIVYLTMSALSIPRFISRRKRLERIYDEYMTK